MADKRLISEIGQFQTDQLQDGHITADFHKSIEREMINQCSGSAYNVQVSDASNFNVCQINRNTVENTSNLDSEATAESKAESKELKNEDNIFTKQEKPLEELTNYMKEIQLDDQNETYYCNRAATYVKLDNDALAVKDHTALSIDPSYSNTYTQLGHILMKQEKPLEELTNYMKEIQLDDQIAAYYCNRAAVHVKLGNDALAVKDYHTALSINPSYSNTYTQLGYILMKQEKHHEALANYTKAIQLDDHNVEYYCNRIVVHIKLGNHALAIKDCQTALSINPLYAEIYNLLGSILSDQKKHHEALANYTKAIQLHDHNVVYYCNRAIVHIKLGNDALAIEDCHTALFFDPSYSSAYNQLGHIFMKQEKHHEALANYTKAIQLKDHIAAYYSNRAVVHKKLGNDALAIKDYHTALSIDPSYSNAYTQLGHLLMKQEKHHEALANYTKAIQLDNHNIEYYISRAIVHEKLGNYTLGITDCQTALSINPSSSEAYNFLGNIFFDQKKYQEALANYTKAIQLKDHIAAYYCNRAAVHIELGNDVLAIKDCHTAISIDPSLSNIYARLGYILVKQEKYLEALANYTKAIQLDDHNVVYYIDRANIHCKLGNRALGNRDYQTILSIDPSFIDTHKDLKNIHVLIDQKEYHEALANYTKLIQLDKVAAIRHTKLDNPVLAVKESLTALSIDPSNSEALTRLGLAFRNLGARLRKGTKRL